MRTREYRTDKAQSIIVGVFALVALGLAGLAFVSGVIRSAQLDPYALALGLLFTGLGVFFIVTAVRPDVLTADDTGLHLRSTFGTKHIPWEAVRAFRVVTTGRSGLQVQAVLHTGKTVRMGSIGQGFRKPGVRQIVAELTQLLRERTETAQPPGWPAGADRAPSPFPGQPEPARGLFRPGSKGRENPRAAFVLCLIVTLGMFGGLLITAAFAHATAGKSADTQAHGLSRSGIVTSVTNYETRSPHSDVGVQLKQPVNGQAATIAHVSPITSLKPGAVVRVLVDPQDPGYAEFPGHQYIPMFPFSLAVASFLACLALMAFLTTRFGRIWYRQRMLMITS